MRGHIWLCTRGRAAFVAAGRWYDAPLGGLGAGAVPIAGGHVEGAVGVLAAAVLLRPTRVTLAVEALELGKPRGVFLPARQHSRDHGRQRVVRGMQAWGGSWCQGIRSYYTGSSSFLRTDEYQLRALIVLRYAQTRGL